MRVQSKTAAVGWGREKVGGPTREMEEMPTGAPKHALMGT